MKTELINNTAFMKGYRLADEILNAVKVAQGGQQAEQIARAMMTINSQESEINLGVKLAAAEWLPDVG